MTVSKQSLKVLVEEDKFFPRFYIVNVGKYFTVVCRHSHWYVFFGETEEEVYNFIKEYNELPLVDYYMFLIKRRAVFPSRKSALLNQGQDESERWLKGAWSTYTVDFYSRFPELFYTGDGESINHQVLAEAQKKHRQVMNEMFEEGNRGKEVDKSEERSYDEEEVKKPLRPNRRAKKAVPIRKKKVAEEKKPVVKKRRRIRKEAEKAITDIF